MSSTTYPVDVGSCAKPKKKETRRPRVLGDDVVVVVVVVGGGGGGGDEDILPCWTLFRTCKKVPPRLR